MLEPPAMLPKLLILFLLQTSALASARHLVWCAVDPYSTASILGEAGRKLAPPGTTIQWVIVQTHPYSAAFEKHLTAFPEGTIRLPMADMDNPAKVDALVQTLKGLKVERVINSTTCEGNYHSCFLSSRLGTDDDDVQTRDLRKKKLEQSEAAGEFGIPSLRLTNVKDALEWVQAFPHDEVTIKFNGGGAAFGLEFASKRNLARLAQILDEKLRNRPRGQFNQSDDIILQPRIVGEEYYIQTFTDEWNSTVTAFWRYYKVKQGPFTMYFVDRSKSLFSKEALELGPILQKLGRKFGKRNGSSHWEMMKEYSTGKWWVIEDNARYVGGAITEVERRLWGISHLELHLLSLLDRERMRKELHSFPRPMQGEGLIFIVPSPGVGVVSASSLEAIENLSTFVTPPDQFKVQPNKAVGTTKDLQSAAFVARFHGTVPQLKSDFGFALYELLSHNLITPSPTCFTFVSNAASLFPILRDRAANIDWIF